MWGLWWTKQHWGRFSPSTSVSPANHTTNFSIIIITRHWHNRPISGRSAEWTQLDSNPHYTNLKKIYPIYLAHKLSFLLLFYTRAIAYSELIWQVLNLILPSTCRSWDSAFGIATGYRLHNRGVGVRVLGGQEFSTQPPIKRVSGALSPGVKRLGREADHSPPTSAEVKKMWTYTSTIPYVFMA
jgi:hypothetical protein